jgi:hypothetical protein
MNKNALRENIKTLFGTILFIILLVILLIPRKIVNEKFEQLRGYTSETIYRDTKDIVKYDKRMEDPSFMSTIDDQNDPLIMKRCYQIPNLVIEDLKNGIKNNLYCATSTYDIITNNFTDVINKIILDIQTVHDTTIKGLIHGPIYIWITQVPYFKNDKGEDISLQSFNTSDFKFQPYYDQKNMTNNPTIYYYCAIFYARYTPTWKLTENDLFKKSVMSQLDMYYTSFEPQCYMVGVGNTDGPFKYAGCASSDARVNGTYSASCLGPKQGNNLLQLDKEDKKNTIVYVINNRADTIKRFIFDNKDPQIPTPWQNIAGIRSLLRINSKSNIECISNDNKNCIRKKDITLSDANADTAQWKPLECGNMHQQLYGKSGYDNPSHWCSKGYRTLFDTNSVPFSSSPSPST